MGPRKVGSLARARPARLAGSESSHGWARPAGILATLLLLVASAASATETRQADRRKGIELFRKGQKAAVQQSWEQALEAFAAAVAVDPHQVEAQHAIGLVYFATRRYPEALAALELCREKYLELASLARLATAREDVKRDEELVDLRNYMSSLNTGRAGTANYLASVTNTQQRMNEVQRLQQRPGDEVRTPARLSLELGVAHHRLGELEPAERELREAIATDPRLGDAHASLAAVALQTGRAALAADEVALAERCHFKVNPTFKADVKAALAATRAANVADRPAERAANSGEPVHVASPDSTP